MISVLKKSLFISVLCFIALISLTACEEKTQEITEITFIHGWGTTEPDHVAMRKIYSDFEKDNPDIKINMLSMPTNSEMIRVVEDMITAGNIPDVVFTAGEGENTIYSFMKENDMLIDLMPYANEDEKFKSNISPIILDGWLDEGRLFTASDVLILGGGYWYNQKIFDRVGIKSIPKTWEEFDDMLSMIDEWSNSHNNSVETIRPSTDTYLYMADNVLMSQGYPVEKGAFTRDKAGMIKVCDIWEMINSHINIDNRNYSYRDEAVLFNEERLAVFSNGIWAASMIDEKIDARYALFPVDESQTGSCQSANLGYLLGKSGDEKRMEASVRFLKYMLSHDAQSRILLETQQMPSNPNINISEYADRLERFCQAATTIQSADIRLDSPRNIWDEDKIEALDRNLTKYLSKNIERNVFISNLGFE